MMAFSYTRLRIGRRQRLSLPHRTELFFFVSARELVAMRHLLMQESGKIACPVSPRFQFSESLAMSTNASTILVVEDDDIVRMLIVDVLEELEFTVLEAEDGGKALAILADSGNAIDLMMTDHGLPGMDGRELSQRARQLRPALPILFASGYAETIDVPSDMQVIGKPFSIDQLRDKVKSILK
jgi:CheY-like chemotaxis protein